MKYFCHEPWLGRFCIKSNGDVVFCPCYLQMKIGSIREKNVKEIWNCETLKKMRKMFSEGDLPDVCKTQICSVVLTGSDDISFLGLDKIDTGD